MRVLGIIAACVALNIIAGEVMLGHLPLWLPGLAAVLLASAGVYALYHRDEAQRLARERARNGWCGACGYDLTGNVSGVCPECGQNGGPR